MIRVELNSEAIRDLLRGAEVQADLKERADRIAAAAGEGVEVEMAVGRNRARATVRTATTEARLAEAKDRKLTAALDAGR